VDVLFILLIVWFGGNAFGRRFRLYSMATLAVVIVFGALAGMEAPRVEANLPTPWIGLTERITIFASLLWIGALTIRLLRVEEVAVSDAVTGREDPKASRQIGRSAAA
jgi:hypothetical protein